MILKTHTFGKQSEEMNCWTAAGQSVVFPEFYTQKEQELVDELANGITEENKERSHDVNDIYRSCFIAPVVTATHQFTIRDDGQVDITAVPPDPMYDLKPFKGTPEQEALYYKVIRMTIQKLNLSPGIWMGSSSILSYEELEECQSNQPNPKFFVGPHFDNMSYFYKEKTCYSLPYTFLVMLSEKMWKGGNFVLEGDGDITKVDFQRNVGILQHTRHSVERITDPVPGTTRQVLSIFITSVDRPLSSRWW